MGNPFFQNPGQRVQTRLGKGDINGRIELIGAFPIERLGLSGEDIYLHLFRTLGLGQAALIVSLKLNRGLVGYHDTAIIGGDRLAAEKHLGGAYLHRVGLAVQYFAQNDLCHLVNKQRREGNRRSLRHRHIGRLQRVMLGNKLAKR